MSSTREKAETQAKEIEEVAAIELPEPRGELIVVSELTPDLKKSIQSRMDELESRLTFQDDLIESLNEVIARQDRELALMTQRLSELEARLNDIAESAAPLGDSSSHEVPPHY